MSVLGENRLKILSDFDGVLTDLDEETVREAEIFRDKLERVAGLHSQEITEVMAMANDLMTKAPHEYGWRVKGRMAAFCDEDAFIRLNAMGSLFDDLAGNLHPILARGRNRLADSSTKTYFELVQQSYSEMTEETARGLRKPLDPEAVLVLKTLLERGVEIVVVSNSHTTRIMQLLTDVGLKPQAQGERKGDAGGDSRLRVRGGAQKFGLGDESKSFKIGPYAVETNRPTYRGILLEEKPNVVIGDVFSLDLGLPLSLILDRVECFENLRILLRKRSYSAAWAINYLEANLPKEVNGGLLKRFDELLAMDLV